jgi:DNA-binding NtrC family response regulator
MTFDGTLRDDKGAARGAEPPKLPHLFVVLECGRPLEGGACLRIEGIDEVLLGRASKRGASLDLAAKRVTLGIPDARMSSKHATLKRSSQGWVLSDSGSTNGTFVGGERLTTELVLEDGASFDLGGTVFLFRTALEADKKPVLFVESSSLSHRAIGLASLVPAQMAAVSSLATIAASDLPVLLLGETGTGKEVTARAVHALSKRAGTFVPVNCGALPETLLESQLFGHVKGAFSGAMRDELGLVRASDRGTLFLDEIGDMRAPSQVALLRLLQEREVLPVGATKAVSVDLRVVAATHRPVDGLEARGFRGDLYARLAGYTHRLVALRERTCDLGILVADLLRRAAPERADKLTIGIDLARAFVAHDWPLNVRELEQALRVTSLLAEDGVLRLAQAPESIRLRDDEVAEEPSAKRAPSSEDAKLRDALVAALSAHGGNVSRVAAEMGRTRMQIHRWMKRFGLSPDTYRS